MLYQSPIATVLQFKPFQSYKGSFLFRKVKSILDFTLKGNKLE